MSFTLLTACGKKTPSRNDAVQKDSLMIVLEEMVKNWSPKNEPWRYVEFEIKEANLTVKYQQKAIHPFLAEYSRKIQFQSEGNTPKGFDMEVNTGGRTLIKVYLNKVNNTIVMEDSFGGYYYSIDKKEYFEKVWSDFESYEYEKAFIGYINGQRDLKFERR